MKQVTQGVRNVMHMAERQGAEPRGSRPELVGRDAGGRFVGAGGNGSAEAMARMKIGLSPAQRRWVESEAARRHVPKTVIVRELLDKALTGGFAAGGPEPARDVGSGGVVDGVADLDGAAMAGSAHVAGGEPGAGSARGGPPGAGGRGGGARACSRCVRPRRRPRPSPALSRFCARGRAGCGAASRRAAVHGADAPARGRGEGGGRVGGGAVRDPSAGESSAHTSQLPPGVGASRPRQAAASPAQAGELLEGLPPGVSLPGGMRADMVSEGADSKSLVVSGGPVSAESGVVVMLPGAGPGGTMGAASRPTSRATTARRVRAASSLGSRGS